MTNFLVGMVVGAILAWRLPAAIASYKANRGIDQPIGAALVPALKAFAGLK
jgi:hypothetical protein